MLSIIPLTEEATRIKSVSPVFFSFQVTVKESVERLIIAADVGLTAGDCSPAGRDGVVVEIIPPQLAAPSRFKLPARIKYVVKGMRFLTINVVINGLWLVEDAAFTKLLLVETLKIKPLAPPEGKAQ